MHILLVRLRPIGDVVFTTPLIRALRRRYPDARLSYVVEPAAEPVVRGNPHLDRIVVLPKRRGLARLRDDIAAARQLRRLRPDMAIDLHGGPRSAWLTWASGAPMRIGYTITGRTWMYTHVVPRPRGLHPRHSVAAQWDILAPLGIAPCDPIRDPLEMVERPGSAARLDARLRAAGVTPQHELIVIHVGASNPFKRWPAGSFTALAVDLARGGSSRRLFFLAGPSEAEAARSIAAATRQQLGTDAGRVLDPIDLDLHELRALAARAALYVGGDSGPLHIAATTTTPIVEILGPTLPERSRPWRDPRWFSETIDAGPLPCRPCHERHCVPGDFRCLTRITPERVLAAAEAALARRPVAAADTLPSLAGQERRS